MLVRALCIAAVAAACGAKSNPGPTSTPTSSAPAPGSAAPAGDNVCGVPNAAPCPAGEFCDYQPSDACGQSAPGSCTAKPAACPRIVMPVCGCDGKTYGNGCEAHGAGVAVKANGGCG
jgi:hypothetical protein